MSVNFYTQPQTVAIRPGAPASTDSTAPEEIDNPQKDYCPQQRNQERSDTKVALIDRTDTKERRQDQTGQKSTNNAYDNVQQNALLIIRAHNDAGQPAQDTAKNDPDNKVDHGVSSPIL